MDVQDINDRQEAEKLRLPDLVRSAAQMFRGILEKLHTAYGLVVFTVLFVFFIPFLWIPILFRKQFRLVGVINRWWARLMFMLIGMPFRVEYRFKTDRRKSYIFCANHFSYLDIPTMGLNRHNTVFVGKNELKKIPLFGYMYGKLHITVDRARLKSRYDSLLRSRQALDEGKSLVIYPEGGITSSHPPQMGVFKDGAFRLAIEKQIPIVPVTIPYNWIILSDGDFILRWRPLRVIFHEPLETAGLTVKDIPTLKTRLRSILESELKKHNQPPTTLK